MLRGQVRIGFILVRSSYPKVGKIRIVRLGQLSEVYVRPYPDLTIPYSLLAICTYIPAQVGISILTTSYTSHLHIYSRPSRYQYINHHPNLTSQHLSFSFTASFALLFLNYSENSQPSKYKYIHFGDGIYCLLRIQSLNSKAKETIT